MMHRPEMDRKPPFTAVLPHGHRAGGASPPTAGTAGAALAGGVNAARLPRMSHAWVRLRSGLAIILRISLALGLAFAGLGLPAAAGAQDLASFAARTTVHVVANGWTFILVERHDAPVFSFCTVADVGSAQEVPGITGLAHMMEHMAFKGTEHIGTRDPAHEQLAMDAEERAYLAYQQERLAPRPDGARVADRLAEFKRLAAEAERFVVKNELDEILARAGAVNVNADTAADRTEYFYSLPANEIELFAYIESERFWHPVFREFYEERDVVQEERRMRIGGDPAGRLIEMLTETAFAAHTFHQPPIGYMSDLESITRTDGERFFHDHYVPASLVTAIVGDIHPAALIPLLDAYFGRIPARPRTPPLRTVEPVQTAEKTVTLADPAQPQLMVAYHRPAVTDPDDNVYDAIDDILSGGRTSRLYRALVRDQQLAIDVDSYSGLPGEKYPNLWTVSIVPAANVPQERVLAALDAEIERLKHADVTDAELAKFKARARAGVVRALGSNLGLATALAEYQTLYGDWRELFRQLDRADRVDKGAIRRVANAALTHANRTVASLVTLAPGQPSPPPPGEAPAAPVAPPPAGPAGHR
jgi:predicted Zn-dependent peptidase